MPPNALPSLPVQQVSAGFALDNPESMLAELVSGTAASPVANQAYFARVRFPKQMLITAMKYGCASASGNVDMGIYDSADGGANLNRLASTGSTACAGTNAIQQVNLTASLMVYPGKDYWLAIAFDNATVTVARNSINSFVTLSENYRGIKATSFPLPTTIATLTATSSMVWCRTVGS